MEAVPKAWDAALRYASALETYVSGEPLPWASLLIERARALVAVGSGRGSDANFEQLRRIRADIERARMIVALPGVDRALEAA